MSPQIRKGKTGGRQAALRWIDAITTELKVATAIKAALRKEAMTKPLRYFKEILMPLVPKEMLLRVGAEEGGMAWVSYLTSNLTERSLKLPEGETYDLEPSAAGGDGERRDLQPPNSSTLPGPTEGSTPG